MTYLPSLRRCVGFRRLEEGTVLLVKATWDLLFRSAPLLGGRHPSTPSDLQIRPPKAGISKEVPQREELTDFSFKSNFSLAKIYERIKLKDINTASNISGIQAYEKCFYKKSLAWNSSDERICGGRMDTVPQPWSSISLSEGLGQQIPQGVFSCSAPSPCLYPTTKHHAATQPADTQRQLLPSLSGDHTKPPSGGCPSWGAELMGRASSALREVKSASR